MSALRPTPNRQSAPASSPDENPEQREIRRRLIQRLAIAICLIVAVGIVISLLNKLDSEPKLEVAQPSISPLQANQPAAPTPSADAHAEVDHSVVADTPATSATPTTSPPASQELQSAPTPMPTPAQNDAPNKAAEPVVSEPRPTKPAEVSTSKLPTKAIAAAARAEPENRAISTPSKNEASDAVRAAVAPTSTATLAHTTASATTRPAPNNSAVDTASTTNRPPSVILVPPPKLAAPRAPTPEQTITALAAGVLPAGSRGFTVQAGVFQSSDNAEKLISRLSAAGIPARTETRVQIGPFHSKDEAEIIMRQLRDLGVTPILQPPAPL